MRRSIVFSVIVAIGTLVVILPRLGMSSAENVFMNSMPRPVLPEEPIPQQRLEQLHGSSTKIPFQAEVNRLMKLIINSLYKTKEIFLRELISNASDALDKIRTLMLVNPNLFEGKPNPELRIRIFADTEEKLLHIEDTGVGMTKDDLMNNLGRVAKSGTAEFMQALDKGSSSNLIGQFGVGFYSVFLVADTITVTTKHNDDHQYIWQSCSDTEYSIVEDPRGNTLVRGTRVTLHLKPEAYDYLKPEKLEALIAKYSEFINYPIYLWKSENRTHTVLEPTEEVPQNSNGQVEDLPPEDGQETVEKPTEKTTWEIVWDFVLMNAVKPLWLRSPKDITDEEYVSFYKTLTRGTDSPMNWTHFKGEGDFDFRALLYIPARAPQELLTGAAKVIRNVKLYVRRVFITDEIDEILPRFLAFVKGLIDSDDFPLNVSREMLQQHRSIRLIRKKLVHKVFELITKLSEDPQRYATFLEQYGKFLKLGLLDDEVAKKRVPKLLRFHTSHPSGTTSLDDYLSRIRAGQKSIYYLAGTNLDDIKKSPFVERLLKRNYEVLFMDDPMDEFMMSQVPQYEGFKFQDLAKEGFEFADQTEEKKKELESMKVRYQPLIMWLQAILSQQVDKVELSNRLAQSPCAIVAKNFGWTGNMERVMKAQAMQNDLLEKFMAMQKKILEINPRHPIIQELLRRVEAQQTDAATIDLAKVLFDTTMMRSGFQVRDSADYFERLERMMRMNVGVDPDATVEVEDEPQAEPETDLPQSSNTGSSPQEDDITTDNHDEL